MGDLRYSLGACCLVMAVSMPAAAQAEERLPDLADGAEAPSATPVVRGFATIGMARFSNPDAGVVSASNQERPVFDRWSADLDSVVGGQIHWAPGGRVEVMAQVVARAGMGWRARPSLAYWQYRWSDTVRWRLGRVSLPVYRDSDIRHVGYANTVVRPPLPIYAKMGAFSHLDGGQLAWETSSGRLATDIVVFFGRTGYRHRLYRQGVPDIDVELGHVHGAVATLNYYGWSARLGHTAVGRYRVRSPAIDALDAAIADQAGALRAIGRAAQADALAGYAGRYGGTPGYTSLALAWASPEWHVAGEWTRADMGIGRAVAWQLVLARSLGRLTPYGFVARQDVRQPPLDEAAFAATGVAALDGGLTAMRGAVLASRQDADLSMRSAGVGVRYDLREGVALKLQAERIRYGAIQAASPGRPRGGGASGTLVSMVVELAF